MIQRTKDVIKFDDSNVPILKEILDKIQPVAISSADGSNTSVASAAFVANSSGIADDTATWGGYKIGQIVTALQNAGLLE